MLEKIITTNPTANLELPKRNRALPKFLTTQEIELLISSAGDIRNSLRLRAMIELLYASGLRVSELCELPISGILGNKLLIHGKGAKERLVPMHDAAIHALNKWLDARGDINSKYVFPTNSNLTLPTPDMYNSNSQSRSKTPAVSNENVEILLYGIEVKSFFFPAHKVSENRIHRCCN